MAHEPDEARPPKKDDSGLVHKPEDSLPKEPAATPADETHPVEPVTPAADPHASTEGSVTAELVPFDPKAHEEPQNHPEEPIHDEYHHYHDQLEQDHHHEEYGGGTPTYAGGSSYGGGEPPHDHQGEPEPAEEEGGPVKSFLDHLEDLRWMMIKCSTAIGIAMILCLISGNYLMEVLSYPLERAEMLNVTKSNRHVNLMVGTNVWGKFKVPPNQFAPFDLATNPVTALQIVTVTIGTNQVLALTPSTNPPPTLQHILRNFGPISGFFIAFQIAMYGGILVSSPLVLYYLAGFILPALKVKEKKYILQGFAVGTGLFLTGVAFCYFVLMPFALNASAKYSEWLGFSADEWTAELYISFICKFMLGMGLGFELPVVVLTLVKIGIVNYRQLAAFRRYMIVINLVLGAVLTTPEVLTQVLMAVPLQLLYEISVWIAWYWERRDRKRAERGETV